MIEPLCFNLDDAVPRASEILAYSGFPEGREVPARFTELGQRALATLRELATPAGLRERVMTDEALEVIAGAGRNATDSPIPGICGRATALAFYTITLGPAVCERIQQCLKNGDAAFGAMLDAAASSTTDRLATIAAERFREECQAEGRVTPAEHVLPYSPGYCGWHISGQRRLFDRLCPDRIGLTLTETFLMQPIKSVSGVFVVGPRDIHLFRNDFDFCAACVTQACRERMRGLVCGPPEGTFHA
jgi:Vitamin B12 dependent methionine synthase, activation domain